MLKVTEVLPARLRGGENLNGEIRLMSMSCNFNTSVVGAAWFAGPAEVIKAAHAAIVGDTKSGAAMIAEGREFRFTDVPYVSKRIQLPEHNTWQMIIRTSRPAFLLGNLEEAVGDYILSPSFTTPVLPEWIPWLIETAKEDGMITECNYLIGMPGYECRLTTSILDDMVSFGLKEGLIEIPTTNRQPVEVMQ